MPAAFDKCQKDGGKIITKTMSGGRYAHICFLNGKSAMGDVRIKGQKAPATDKQGG